MSTTEEGQPVNETAAPEQKPVAKRSHKKKVAAPTVPVNPPKKRIRVQSTIVGMVEIEAGPGGDRRFELVPDFPARTVRAEAVSAARQYQIDKKFYRSIYLLRKTAVVTVREQMVMKCVVE